MNRHDGEMERAYFEMDNDAEHCGCEHEGGCDICSPPRPESIEVWVYWNLQDAEARPTEDLYPIYGDEISVFEGWN